MDETPSEKLKQKNNFFEQKIEGDDENNDLIMYQIAREGDEKIQLLNKFIPTQDENQNTDMAESTARLMTNSPIESINGEIEEKDAYKKNSNRDNFNDKKPSMNGILKEKDFQSDEGSEMIENEGKRGFSQGEKAKQKKPPEKNKSKKLSFSNDYVEPRLYNNNFFLDEEKVDEKKGLLKEKSIEQKTLNTNRNKSKEDIESVEDRRPSSVRNDDDELRKKSLRFKETVELEQSPQNSVKLQRNLSGRNNLSSAEKQADTMSQPTADQSEKSMEFRDKAKDFTGILSQKESKSLSIETQINDKGREREVSSGAGLSKFMHDKRIDKKSSTVNNKPAQSMKKGQTAFISNESHEKKGGELKKLRSNILAQTIVPMKSKKGLIAKLPLSPSMSRKFFEKEKSLKQFLFLETVNDLLYANFYIEEEAIDSSYEISIDIVTLDKEPKYDWEIKSQFKFHLPFKNIYEAYDSISGKSYGLKIVDYETWEMDTFHVFLQNILLLRYFTLRDYPYLVKIHDIYVTQHIDIFTGNKKNYLIIVTDLFQTNLLEMLEVRKKYDIKWEDEVLLNIYRGIYWTLMKLPPSFASFCDIHPKNIYFCLEEGKYKLSVFRSSNKSHSENIEQKLRDVFKIIYHLRTLNFEAVTKKIMDVEVDENGARDFSSSHLHALNEVLKAENMEHIQEVSSKLEIAPHVLPKHEDDDFSITENYVPEKIRLDTKETDKRHEIQADDHVKLLQIGKAYKIFDQLKNEYAELFPDSPERSYFLFESGHLLYHLGLFEESNTRLRETKTYLDNIKMVNVIEDVEMRVEVLINLALVEAENKSLEKFTKIMEEAFNLVKKHQFSLQLKVSQMHLYVGLINDRLGFNFSHLKNALKGYQEALQIKRSVLGPNANPFIYEILTNIGILNLKLGRLDDALQNFEELNEIENQKSLDPNTGERKSEILSNMSIIYKEKGNLEKAKSLLEQALEIQEVFYGGKSGAIADTYCNLGIVTQMQGLYRDALVNFKSALKMKKELNLIDDLNMCHIYNNLGNFYLKIGLDAKALEYLKEALIRKSRLYGNSSLEIAKTMNNIALVYERDKNFEEAVKYYEESLIIKKKFFGNDHLGLCPSLTNLFYVYAEIDDLDSSIKCFNQILSIKTKCNMIDISLVDIISTLAEFYQIQGNLQESLDLYNKRLEFLVKIYKKKECQEVCETHERLGDLYYEFFQNDKAIKSYEESIKLYRAIFNNEPVKEVGHLLKKIGDIYKGNKKSQKSMEYYEEAMKILKIYLNDVDPLILELKENMTPRASITSRIGKTFSFLKNRGSSKKIIPSKDVEMH